MVRTRGRSPARPESPASSPSAPAAPSGPSPATEPTGPCRPRPTAFPWSSFLVNVAGSFVLGVILTLVVERWSPTRFVRPFAAIGFCGGFTTFSTFAVEIVAARPTRPTSASPPPISWLSLLVGLAAATAGIAVGPRTRARSPASVATSPIPTTSVCCSPSMTTMTTRTQSRSTRDRPRTRRRGRARRRAPLPVDHTVQRRARSDFPLGTLVVNTTGSLVLGLLVGVGGSITVSRPPG